MPISPVTVEQFRGLRLLAEQGEAAGAISMLNADLARGATQIGTRGGTELAATGTADYHRIAYGTLLFRNTGSAVGYQVLNIATGTVGTITNRTWGGATTRVTSTTALATHDVAVAARAGSSNEALKRTDSDGVPSDLVTFTPAASPRYLERTPWDDRMVMAHFTSAAGSPSGANGSTSAVFFSNPSDDTTWGADNWIELSPNDGRAITGMVSWQDRLFVLKENALFVFYGTSTDSTGGAIFNYRRIDLPSTARTTTNLGGENIIAGGDGVYLLLGDGVYRTTGDVPQNISRDITPLFDGTGDSTMVFPDSGDWTIGYAINRFYLSYPVNGTYRTLVYDSLSGEWLLWDLTAGSAALPTNVIEVSSESATDGLPTAFFAAGAKVHQLSATATDDAGTAIVSSYQPGFDGLGYPTQEKRIRSVELVGSGAPTLTVLTDYATSDPLSRQATVTLGTAPAVDGATHSKAYRGRLFSPKLSATSGAWSVARLTWNVTNVRSAGMRSA